MRTFRRNPILMSAVGVLLASTGAVAAQAIDRAERFVVTGALRVTHTITEQVCDFDTLEQLETYLANVIEAHHWFRHDKPAAASLDNTSTTTDAPLAAPMGLAQIVGENTALDQIDTTAAQVETLASAPAVIVNLDLDQLRAGATAADAMTVTSTVAA